LNKRVYGMRIEKLDIKGFGKLQKRTIKLEPGLNIIYGSNEAGKTTLQYFIKGMLFGLKGGRRYRDGTLPALRQYNPWRGTDYGGVMTYLLDNGRRFTVRRNFSKNTIVVQDEYSNDITREFPAGKEEGVKFAEQHLGLTANSFEHTAFIGQMQCAVGNEGKKILAERLTNIRQSGDEEISFRNAMNVLKEAQLSLVGSDRTTMRPINLIERRLEDAIKEEQQYSILHQSMMDNFVELNRLYKEEQELKVQLEKLGKTRELVASNMKIQGLQKQYQILCDYHTKLKKLACDIHKAEEQINNLNKKVFPLIGYRHITHGDVEELQSDYTRYLLLIEEQRETLERRNGNNEKLIQAKQVLEQYDFFDKDDCKIKQVLSEILDKKAGGASHKHKEYLREKGLLIKKRRIKYALFVFIMLILSATILFQDSIGDFPLLLPVIPGAILSLVLAILFIRDTRKINRIINIMGEEDNASQEENNQLLNKWMRQADVTSLQDFIRVKTLFENNKHLIEELEEESILLKQDEQDLQNKINQLKVKILDKLNRVNPGGHCDTINDEAIQNWKKDFSLYNTITTEVKNYEDSIEDFRTREDGIYRELSLILEGKIKTYEILEEAIESIKRQLDGKEPVTVEEYETIEQVNAEIEICNERINQNKLNINVLNTRLENIPDGEMLIQAHEKVQRLQKEKSRITFLGRALDTAMEVLSEASLIIQRDYVPMLNKEMSHILSSITGGKYVDISADDQLTLKIQPDGMAETVIPEQLSQGASDQVYLALRLATVRLAEKNGESLPLFLDEPFSQYDENRTKNAIILLMEESFRRQIVLFTCKMREVEFIRKMCGNETPNIINLD
jgi:DNA repair exonuclease SbcCD ATPase subunit